MGLIKLIGIYFATDPNATHYKAHHKGVILKAQVDLGKVKHMTGLDPTMTLGKLGQEGFDSVYLPQGDGTNLRSEEYVIYEPSRVVHIERA